MTDISAELRKCAKCGKCRAVCPTFLVSRDETMVARGRIALWEAIKNGTLPPSDCARRRLLTCYGCMRCVESCPSGVRVDLVIRDAREAMARERGIGCIAKFVFRRVLPRRKAYDALVRAARRMQKLLRRDHVQPLRHLPLFYGGRRRVPPLARRSALRTLPEMIKGRGDIKVSLFIGCILNYVYPEIAASIMRILEIHGVDIILPRAQLCCGTPVLGYGDVEAARRLALRNIECLEPAKVDAVVLGCASCGLTMKRDYPSLVRGADDFAAKVCDITEFIDRFLGYSNIPLDEKVTYHDPCHLRWGRGVAVPPREILRQSSRFVEMENAGDCCGLGGSFSLANYDISCALGEAKVQAACLSGADIIATACPGCILQLQDQLSRRKLRIPVMHVAQIYELSYLRGRSAAGIPSRDDSARAILE